ncbi:metal-sulfur cluster assembly factor [Brevibacillus humidisoli]|uniref:metal-sulfur cluster assembly factor n=1 Tax=Brevibacillus humidisoli TaxID=2895522 RepID=UPI001E532F95|nr:metal-sulfur cluster assembly factor [Brevibacillus humidisoli]UFJ41837.1 metal-sulfur cluster assembly factor [Brevibacillus humidisoli]
MDLVEKVWSGLEEVIDPELEVNIVDLGLVYDIQADANHNVKVTMTMTIPECPLQDVIVSDVEKAIKRVPGVKNVEVNLVWEPAWTPARMTDWAIEEIKRRRALV